LVHTLMKEMIDIISDKDKVIRSLQELEFEFAQGNISQSTYSSQKKELESNLETLEVADRVRRMQGKGDVEKPLEYWTEKKEAEEAKQAKEELMKKYITASSSTYPAAKTGKVRGNKSKAILTAFLALIFFGGIGFGIFLMKVPEESAAVPMSINQSAFPVINNTTNITDTNITELTDTTTTITDTSGDTGTGGTGNGTST
jgi:hypothetical protein